jgi:hypothetical protein
MIRLRLKPDVETELAAVALRHGQTPNEFVERVVERTLASESIGDAGEPNYRDLPPEEWIKKFNEWMDRIPARNSPPLSDWAVSRDSIYH